MRGNFLTFEYITSRCASLLHLSTRQLPSSGISDARAQPRAPRSPPAARGPQAAPSNLAPPICCIYRGPACASRLSSRSPRKSRPQQPPGQSERKRIPPGLHRLGARPAPRAPHPPRVRRPNLGVLSRQHAGESCREWGCRCRIPCGGSETRAIHVRRKPSRVAKSRRPVPSLFCRPGPKATVANRLRPPGLRHGRGHQSRVPRRCIGCGALFLYASLCL